MPFVTREYGEKVAKEFYEDIFSKKALDLGWINIPASDGKVTKDPISHTCMNGALYSFQDYQPKMIHSGTFFVPIDPHPTEKPMPGKKPTDDEFVMIKNPNKFFIDRMAKAIAKGAKFYLSELATDVHPAYFDIDYKTNYSSDDVAYMLSVIKGVRNPAVISGDEMATPECSERSPNFWDDFENSYLLQKLLEIDVLPYDCLPPQRKRFHKPSLSWIGLFEDMVNVRGFNLDVRQESRDVLQYMFIMSIAAEIQMVVSSFYPETPINEFRTMVLTTLAKDGHGIRIGKIGGHIYMREIRVDTDMILRIRESIIRHFAVNFGGSPGSNGRFVEDRAFWSTVIDCAIYGPKKGLRMPYCFKTEECEHCKKRRNRLCTLCYGSGKITVDRQYKPCAVLWMDKDKRSVVVNLSMNDYEKVKMYTSRLKVNAKDRLRMPLEYYLKLRKTFDKDPETRIYNTLSSCCIRLPRDAVVTPGASLDDKPFPQDLGLLHEQMIEHIKGDKNSIGTVRKYVKQMIGKRDDVDPTEITALYEHRIHLLKNDITPEPMVRSVQIPPTDSRYVAIGAYLPKYLEKCFDRRYKDISIRTVTMVYTDSLKQIPSKIIVYVRGYGARLCFNRTISRSGKGNDNSTVAGEHTSHHNCVYFVIDREGCGRITQKCCNQTMKNSLFRRNASLSETETSSCKAWPGKTIILGSMNDDINSTIKSHIRDMFYTEEQQSSDAMLIQEQNYQRRRMMKEGKKEEEANVVGPHENPNGNKKIRTQ